MIQVEKILRRITQLPPFPAVVQRALQMIADPKTSAQDVVDVIQYDQSITADLLKLCNSAYFGLQRKVYSLREALVLVGFNQLFEIVLGRQSSRIYAKSCAGYDLQKGELWQHSVACALLSRIVSRRLNQRPSPVLFTAALLHDIGKVILSEFVADYLEEITKLLQDPSVSFNRAEKQILGIDHAELGGKISEAWKFPKAIVAAIRCHHVPFSAPDADEVIRLTHLCDMLAMLTGIGGGTDGLHYHPSEEVLTHYRLTEKDIDLFMVKLNDEFDELKALLDVA